MTNKCCYYEGLEIDIMHSFFKFFIPQPPCVELHLGVFILFFYVFYCFPTLQSPTSKSHCNILDFSRVLQFRLLCFSSTTKDQNQGSHIASGCQVHIIFHRFKLEHFDSASNSYFECVLMHFNVRYFSPSFDPIELGSSNAIESFLKKLKKSYNKSRVSKTHGLHDFLGFS
jgi:hypothetical protein